MKRDVILVGHCDFDGPRLQKEISAKMPNVNVTRLNDEDEFDRIIKSSDAVLLINREPVGMDRDGIELVRCACESNGNSHVMLISDYEDAQEEAEELGALPGFGKADIGSPKLVERI